MSKVRVGQNDANYVKHMVVDGFYVDEEDPQNPLGWGFNKWELVGESIGLLAANFAKHGYDIIINGYISQGAWVNIEKHVKIDKKILLLPHLAKVVERDATRPQDYVMGEATVAVHHQEFSSNEYYRGFAKLDSTDHSVDETVQMIKSLL